MTNLALPCVRVIMVGIADKKRYYGIFSGSGAEYPHSGNFHHFDTGMLLDKLGVAVRTGHHCAEPLMHRLGIEGTVRASFGLYNTIEECDAFIAALKRVAAILE